MKLRLAPLGVLALLALWNCATPPAAPPSTPPPPAGPDDDHRLVGVEEFLASPFVPVPGVKAWEATDHGVVLALHDGTTASLTFVAPGVVRWWLSGGDAPRSPGARYGEAPRVRVVEGEGSLVVETPAFGVRLELANLSWSVVRSGQTLLATQGAPQRWGRRMVQAFQPRDLLWTGPGLARGAARHWAQPGTFATPTVFGVGTQSSVALTLDSSYQTYTASAPDRVALGSLNGGLDLLVSVASRPDGVVQGLTAVTGRPGVAPDWVHGTTLVLPGSQPGTFVRRAKLSIEGAWGAEERPGFRLVASVAAPTGDPTVEAQRRAWAEGALSPLPQAAGVGLQSSFAHDWGQNFDDGGVGSPLARIAPLLPRWEALGLVEALRHRNPTARPLVLTTSGGPGIVRQAWPMVDVGPTAGDLDGVLALGLAGLGTPAVRLSLADLEGEPGRSAALGRLSQWLLVPVLVLDWGATPEATWASLTDVQKRQMKALLDHRSRFKSYLVQQTRATASTGRPAWVPLWYDFPNDPKARAVDDEYLMGSLLVAPSSGPTRKVYLPGAGVWFDFWSGEEFGGGRTYEVEVRADRPVVFARAGALVGLREPEAFDGKDVANPPTVHVFPGARGVGTYWMDDGLTEAWKTGTYHETRLMFDFDQKSMSLEHQSINLGRTAADPYLLYRLHNLYKPRQVKMAGKPIPLFGDSWGITDSDRSAAWYESDHTLLIKVFRPERDQAIEILF